jgi:ubiquinone/menaquinone biosynthesis C-methylase UbiE
LAQKYEKADMKEFYEFITPYLKGEKLLDIGCGSGRDIGFYLKKGFKVAGVEPANEFLKMCKAKYPKLKFYDSLLQKLNIPEKNFDVVTVVAVWMHLKRIEYYNAIESIKKYLKKRGIVIVSYSANKREGFDYINPKYLRKRFTENGFKKVAEKIGGDAMERKIKWITQIYVKIT